jgi:hypothetical protein
MKMNSVDCPLVYLTGTEPFLEAIGTSGIDSGMARRILRQKLRQMKQGT